VPVTVPALAGAPSQEEGCPRSCTTCARLRQALLSELEWKHPSSIDAGALAAGAGLGEADLVDHYGSVDGCLVATYEALSDELYALQVDALANGSGDWQSNFLDGVRAALDHLAAIPGAMVLFFADELRGHPLLRVRRAAARQRVARLLADHSGEAGNSLRSEFLLGALAHAAHSEAAARGMQPARVAARIGATLRLLEPRAA
jgi:hypothetical protein